MYNMHNNIKLIVSKLNVSSNATTKRVVDADRVDKANEYKKLVS